MRRPALGLFAGISILLLAMLACVVPQKITATPIISFPTPNLTLTAFFNPTLIVAPTNTIQLPTAQPAGVTPSATLASGALATSTAITPGVATATSTNLPGLARTVGLATATFLTTPPKLDGTWGEWGTKEYPASFVVWKKANWTGESDLDAAYRVGWDMKYLYLAVKVRDNVYAQQNHGDNIYLGDSLELLLDTNLQGDFYYNVLSPDDYQLGISPGFQTVGNNPEAFLWFPRSISGGRSSVKIAAVSMDGGYRVEAAIPWSIFSITPFDGMQVGFGVSVSDDDNTSQAIQQKMVSSLPFRNLANPTTWGELTLSR